MSASPRRLQTLLALAVAGLLCWAGLAFRPRRTGAVAWPVIARGEFPREVRLPDGSAFTLATPPRRVVLASATVVDFATALVGRDRIAALCEQAFTASAIALDPEPWRGLPTHARFTAEVVLACAPDLVLCNDYNDQQTTDALRKAGVPTLVLPGPSTFAECLRALELVGAALGADAEAAALLASLRRRADALPGQRGGEPQRRGICFTYNPTGGWTGGTRTLHHEALVLAGLANAAAAAGIEGHAPLGIEQLVGMDPDLLVVDAPVGAAYGSLHFLRENPVVAALPAVRSGHVLELHPALYATGSHHVLDAAESIATAAARLPAERGR
jgi:iron complex transport system substrate-binding protein